MQAKSLLVLVILATSTARASVTVQCSGPEPVACVVSEPQGIRTITVRAEASVLVETSYGCVPAATVAFDARGSQLEVTTCGADGIPPRPADGYGAPAYTYALSNGVLRRVESGGALEVVRPGLVYAALYPLRVVGGQVERLPALLLGFVAANPPPLRSTYYCCTEGTHAHCWPVNALAVCGAGLDFVVCDDDGKNCGAFPN